MRGHIALKGKKYYIVVDVRDELTNKRKRKWLTGLDGKGFDRKRDAEREMPDILKRYYEGAIKATPYETIGELLERWLADKKGTVRYSTWKSYEWLIETYLIPNLGKVKADKLKPKQIRSFYHEILAPKLSKASIRKLHVIFVQVLDWAVSESEIPKNVARGIKLPEGTGKKKFDVWNEEQLDLFLKHASRDQFFMIFDLAANTGMRQSEILGLPRDELDLKIKTLYIRNSYLLIEGGRGFDDPKNETSERPVPLFAANARNLKIHLDKQRREMKQKQNIYRDHGLVFQTGVGTPVNPRNLMRNYYAIIKRIINEQDCKKAQGEPHIEFKKIRFQDLRHTHATILLKKGVHPKIVQERLGHSSIQVTLDIYSHVIPNLQESVLKEIGDSITGNLIDNMESHEPILSVDYDEGSPNTYRGIIINWNGDNIRINTGDFYRDYGHALADYAPCIKSNTIDNFIRDLKIITLSD